jgi:hypothetical protein
MQVTGTLGEVALTDLTVGAAYPNIISIKKDNQVVEISYKTFSKIVQDYPGTNSTCYIIRVRP